MGILSHLFLSLVSAAVIWFFAGILLDSTEKLARRSHRAGFAVAFLLLGFLTSISEISVAVNSSLVHVPQISAGNLIGASFVIFLFVIPLLAIFGKGIQLKHSFTPYELILSLIVILLPSLFTLDGRVNVSEGFLMAACYIILLYFVQRRSKSRDPIDTLHHTYKHSIKTTAYDLLKILIGAVLIFFASRLLVREAIYFSDLFRIPASFIGLLILALGTNVPEIVIVIRSVLNKHKDIAFGDYIGSAAMNTFVFAGLVLFNGTFNLARQEFWLVSLALVLGLILFWIFSRSGRELSRNEALVLLGIYLVFVVIQLITVPQTPPFIEQ